MSEAQASKKTVYEEVSMDNGDTVKFPGKRRLLKSSAISDDQLSVTTTFHFRNGEVRTFNVDANAALFAQFAAHGIEQKIGDEVAGLEDVEDMVLAIDDILERLSAGQWTAQRESSGLAGTSVLARALIEVTGKTPAQIKEFLSGKSNSEKLALRQNSKIAPVVARLEANKKVKAKAEVDTEALLCELSNE
jgi:hypothetical protein